MVGQLKKAHLHRPIKILHFLTPHFSAALQGVFSQPLRSPGAQELGALLGAEVFDFTGLRWTERVHALAAAQVWGTAERDRRPVR